MNEDLTKVYGFYLSRDDNEEHPIHECILPLRHYRKLIEILSKSLESEQNHHSKVVPKWEILSNITFSESLVVSRNPPASPQQVRIEIWSFWNPYEVIIT